MAVVQPSLINPRYLDNGELPYFKNQNQFQLNIEEQTLDKNWLKTAFMVSDAELEDEFLLKNRYYTSANLKFTDTSMGGNIGVNSRPSFTPYSDIPVPGRLKTRTEVSVQNTGGKYGMGRYYSEAIDDNAQTIFIKFGVPQFNSLMTFLTKSFDPQMTSLARTGRMLDVWYTAARALGAFAIIKCNPVLSALVYGAQAVKWLFADSGSKFYTLKPTMHTYWATVNSMVNAILINKGIMPRVEIDGVDVFDNFLKNKDKDQHPQSPYKLDQEYLDKLHSFLPDTFNAQNGFDIFAAALKAQVMANRLQDEDFKTFNNGSATDFTDYIKKLGQDSVTNPPGNHTFGSSINNALYNIEQIGLYDYIASVLKVPWLSGGENEHKLEVDVRINPENGESVTTHMDEFQKYSSAALRNGADFAVFKVDHTGSARESFSNSAQESDLSSKFNGISSQAREARFTFANGNIGGEFLKSVTDTVADVASGALDGATFGVFSALTALAGSGFIDVPKHWQSSNASLSKMDYKIQLISPYGNVYSQMQNIYIPLAMILAGGLPLSTGKQSYTSPFICQVFDRGRCQVKLGMIDSISITRGTSNLPFNNRGNALAIDVSFSIVDLSSIMHMPISSGSLFNGDMTTDSDNILQDYLAVLSGQDIYSQVYPLARARMKAAKLVPYFNKFFSPAAQASFVDDTLSSGILKYISPYSLWKGMVHGSNVVTH